MKRVKIYCTHITAQNLLSEQSSEDLSDGLWIHPPFQMIGKFLKHYEAQQRLNPRLSALASVPQRIQMS